MTKNPAMTPSVPTFECSPRCASGISSSTTTYIMAPAENASIHGMYGEIRPANSTTRMPNTGSARPDSAPSPNAFGALMGLQSAGLTAGRDFSLVGYDDIGEAALWHPALTTVFTRIPEYGHIAAELALARIAEPGRPVERVALMPRLVVRETTTPPRHR